MPELGLLYPLSAGKKGENSYFIATEKGDFFACTGFMDSLQ